MEPLMFDPAWAWQAYGMIGVVGLLGGVMGLWIWKQFEPQEPTQ